MSDANDLDRERLLVERERMKLERQKLAIEVALKRRELSSRSGSHLKDILTNPISLAVVGGFLTLMSGIITTAYTAANARQSARDSLQADLIKKFVEGPSHAAVRDNLKFLVDAGLLPTYAEDIRAYLKENPDAAPQVNFAGGIVGSDDAVQVSNLPPSDMLVKIGRSVGQLTVRRNGSLYSCTGFVLTPDIVLTAGHCVTPDDSEQVFNIGGTKITVASVEKRARPTDDDLASNTRTPNYALLRLSSPTRNPGLALSSRAPSVGEDLAVVLFRASSTKQFAVRSPDCSVRSVANETFDNLCDTGGGSSGAPVVSALSGEVLGVHGGRSISGAWATRADVIKKIIAQP